MATDNVEATYNALLTKPHEVTLSNNGAAEVWKLFRPDRAMKPDAFNDFKYRAFLQAAMIGWIDASQAIGFVEALWKGSVKPNATVLSIIRALAKETMRQYYRNEIKGEPALYLTVKDAILYSTRPYFDMIQQGMEMP